MDSFSLNSSYFLAKSVPVLGAVFNLGDTCLRETIVRDLSANS